MKKSRNLLIILFVVFVFLALSGKENETIELELGIFVGSNWNVGTSDTYVIVDKVIEKFENKYPHVKVSYTSGIRKEDYSEWYAQKLLEGHEPDVAIILTEDFERIVSLGGLVDLTELIDQDEEVNPEDYYETALEAGQANKEQFAMPYEIVPTLMFVNRTLLENEGIEMPSSDWTWDDLYAIGEQITKDRDGDGVLDQFATANYTWEDALDSNGAHLFAEDGSSCNISDSKTEDAIRFVKKINELHQNQNVTQEDFDGGNVAFMPLSFAEYKTYKTYPYKINKYTNFKWECVPMPAGPNGDNVSRLETLLMGIGANTKEKEFSWELLKMFVNDERMQMHVLQNSQSISALKRVTNSNEAEYRLQRNMSDDERIIDMKILDTVINKSITVPRFSKYTEAVVLFDNQVTRMFRDEINVESTLKKFEREMNLFLNR